MAGGDALIGFTESESSICLGARGVMCFELVGAQKADGEWPLASL